jgi:hypothetical protein
MFLMNLMIQMFHYCQLNRWSQTILLIRMCRYYQLFLKFRWNPHFLRCQKNLRFHLFQ